VSYLIGVDGGGTKTEAIAYDLKGNIIGIGTSGFGNVLIDYAKAIGHITEAIQAAKGNLRAEDCLYLYLGLAGIEESPDRKKLATELQKKFGTQVSIVNDAIIAHAAFLQGKDGILTISGTGSISIGKVGKTYAFTGGWGHLLGDEGSGYWIAMKGFRQMIYEEDTSSPLSELTQVMLKELGFNNIQQIKRFIYSATKAEIAAFVPLIATLASKGEPTAASILEQAGHHLGEITWNLSQKLKLTEDVKIAIKGKVLETLPLVQNTFKAYLQTRIKRVSFIKKEVSSTKGAYYLAKQELGLI
jgi:N-acetylglucosamine kinase-like BadF-type ATPase